MIGKLHIFKRVLPRLTYRIFYNFLKIPSNYIMNIHKLLFKFLSLSLFFTFF